MADDVRYHNPHVHPDDPAPPMNQLLSGLFGHFFRICRLQSGPQDLPAAPLLRNVSLLLYLLLSLVTSGLNMPMNQALVAATIDLALLIALTTVILMLRGLGTRITQTLTALAGCSVILSLFSIPMLIWLHAARDSNGDAGIPSLMMLALVIWNLLIIAHIFRHALSTLFAAGLLLAIGYFWLQLVILNALLPAL